MIMNKPTYVNLPIDFYQINSPKKFPDSECLIWNNLLDLDNTLSVSTLNQFEQQLTKFLKNGNSELVQNTLSQAYMGHQFGHLNMLGDGRAHLIGELVDGLNRRWEVQLKGSGQSQYSRRGDGVAALGPMLREMLMSEAMHALGVATTRSLAVFATHEIVSRQKNEPGGVLVRLSKSHVRVGTFQFAFHHGGISNVKILADYMIERMSLKFEQSKNPYQEFFREVVSRQAKLIAQWLSLGFVHGVMNTDNMSIIGETIDYGPCAFIDQYHPLAVFSSIDQQGRYAYIRQVEIAQWNLARLAESLLEIFSDTPDEAKIFANQVLNDFTQQFQSEWFHLMSRKIGFEMSINDQGAEKTWQQVIDLLDIMTSEKLDFTNTFLYLTGEFPEVQDFNNNEKLNFWIKNWLESAQLMGVYPSQLQLVMKKANPFIIPRNYLVEEVIEKAVQGDLSFFIEFMQELQTPFQKSELKNKMQFLPNTTNTSYQTFCGT